MPIAGFLERPFGRLAYEDQGEGLPLVFAHGLGGNHLSWWRQIAEFRKAYRCIAFSHRGFAPSDPVPGGPDPLDYAGDLESLLDHLEIDRAVIVGQSMGGWTMVEFALKHPARVAGMVFASTTGTLDFTRLAHPATAALPAWQAKAKAEAAALAAEKIHPACGRRMAAAMPELYELYLEIDRMNASLDKEAIRGRLARTRSRPPADLDRVPAPKLFIAGGEDIVMPAAGIEALAKAARDARHVCVKTAGHSVYFEQAEIFNAALGAFLREIAPPSRRPAHP